ncbi:pantoate--beta-alanine ligase [Anaerobacillus sp. MEB173]|uniref:pantoate--beta-alanine ligase n=1 Tax=Anaerobacillus sp. MEB173 TaxID=3383345 RepID=UPI003F90F4A6
MKIVKTITEMQELVQSYKQDGKSVGFVPTMGYLHEGHLSLMNKARSENDILVVSIFVNPLQFGPNEDFDRYPRDFDRDEALAKNASVDIIFYPDVKEMYPKEMAMTIHVQQGIDVLCGRSRPGHFDGVATVVLKLFNIVMPTNVYFGMKDAQQVAVITQLIENFNLPINLVPCDTLREEDGLAKSSRNVYLSSEERKQASAIYQSLQKSIERIKTGERNPLVIREFITSYLTDYTDGMIDYAEILSYPELKEIEHLNGNIIIAIALKFEKARLIDNVTLTVES